MRRCKTLYRELENNLLQKMNDIFKAVCYVRGGLMLRNEYIKLKRKVIVQKIISRCRWHIILVFVYLLTIICYGQNT